MTLGTRGRGLSHVVSYHTWQGLIPTTPVSPRHRALPRTTLVVAGLYDTCQTCGRALSHVLPLMVGP